jgi:hypothetical protein
MATFNELLEMVTSINVMSFMTQVLTIRVRWRVSYGRQELFTLCYHLGSHSMFGGVCVDHSLSRRCFVVSLCFVCSVSCVPSVASVFRLSILCCQCLSVVYSLLPVSFGSLFFVARVFRLSILCCQCLSVVYSLLPVSFGCLFFVASVFRVSILCCQCLSGVYSLLPLRFSLAFI